jgi:hypothetical protein
MNGLEGPGDLAGRRLQGDDAVGVRVVAGPVAAEVVGAGAADRQIDEAAGVVDDQP